MSGNGVHGSGGPAGELNQLFEGVPWAADDDEVVGARPEEAPIAVNVAIGEEVAGAAEVAAGGAEAAEASECGMASRVCVWSFNNFNPYEAYLPGRNVINNILINIRAHKSSPQRHQTL